jgi:hypothetical protein
MPDTLSQSKAIYEKEARSAAIRRARLLRIKTSRPASRSTVVTPTVTTSSKPRGKQQLLQLRAQLASEQEARTRDRTIYYEHFNQQQPNTVIYLVTSFCRACCGFFILYLGIVLLYYYGVHLLRRYQWHNITSRQ